MATAPLRTSRVRPESRTFVTPKASYGETTTALAIRTCVSNMGTENRLYRNNRDGSFTDVASKLGVTRPIVGFPAWFWNYDNDGALDLFVAAYGTVNRPDVADVAASYLNMRHRADLMRLYRGTGQGEFVDVTAEQRVTRVTLAMGANFGDLDYDGFPDFFLGTGYPLYEGVVPNVMYHNRRGGGTDVTTAGGFGHLQKGHGVVFADLDNDGDQDVFEQIGGAYPGDAFGTRCSRTRDSATTGSRSGSSA